MSQEVPEVRFWGQSKPISGSSVRTSIITPQFHKMCGASSASGYLHYELHRRLVDSSSVTSVGSSASRCRSCPHERVGVMANRQKSMLSPLQRITLLGVEWESNGQPLSHDQGHAAMLSCLGNVEEILVPVPGSCVGSFMSSQDANDRCFSHGQREQS